MIVWIDMDNSPHVPLLLPFINNLEAKGHNVLISARDYAQTVELLRQENIEFKKIGKHAGPNKIAKVIGLLKRSIQLIAFARDKKIGFAISHGSRAQAIACKILKIPCFIGMDYEHTESRIFAICATKIWIPEILYPSSLPFIGVSEDRVLTYKGIKEQFYLKGFISDPLFKEKLGIPLDKILVALRPPADQANYHDGKSELLIEEIIQSLAAREDVYTICTPRTMDQRKKLKKYESTSFKVLESAVDGKNLAYYVDTMISGGGTMNREAAFFGAQVYSIFSGKKPMLDLELQKLGLLSFITSRKDCKNIQFKKKSIGWNTFEYNDATQLEQLIDIIIHHVKKVTPHENPLSRP